MTIPMRGRMPRARGTLHTRAAELAIALAAMVEDHNEASAPRAPLAISAQSSPE